jgi:acetate kinase
MTKDYVIVINCGSSSIKFAVFDLKNEQHIYHGLVDNVGTDSCHLSYSNNNAIKGYHLPNASITESLAKVIEIFKADSSLIKKLAAIGHRVVHGGSLFTKPTKVTPSVIAELKKLSILAPLHNPSNIAGIEECISKFPKVKNVAVFDTAFHSHMPEIAATYAIDRTIAEKYHIKRYGFHGISHNYIYDKYLDITRKKDANIISVHLGNGASIAAIKKGISVDTSMGFTPLAGLVMGTRSGDIDPGVHQYLASCLNLSLSEITENLNKNSGLKALSKLTHDMRRLEEEYKQDNSDAKLALNVFTYNIAKYIASYLVPLKKIDAIVFTGGIGENSALVRQLVCDQLSYLHIHLCLESNKHNENVITQETSAINVYVIKTNEELLIAKLAAGR